MKKQFACIWTVTYNNMVGTYEESFFTEENGYDEEQIQRIQLANIGVPICIEFGCHYVIRLSDVAE